MYDRWSGDAADPVGEEEVEAGDQGQLDDLLLIHCQGLLSPCLYVFFPSVRLCLYRVSQSHVEPLFLLKVMKKSEKQEQNQGEVEDEGADRKYQVFRRNTFDRHLIEVKMIRGVSSASLLF